MRRRKRKNKQIKFITITSLSLLFILTVGYAAFQTNLNITAKGNIFGDVITTSMLKQNFVISGDGLYKDTTEAGRYIYKGLNPNNYITFNNEKWRIISVENDGTIKIIKNESVVNMPWDVKGNRSSSSSTYCVDAENYGCNAWAATTNLINTPSVFTLYNPNGNPNVDTDFFSGTVIQDSSLNTYLNTTYLETIGNDFKYIVNHEFNVGTPGNAFDTENMDMNISQEALYKWKGKVGIMNITDVLKTTTNTTCVSLNAGYESDSTGNCNTNNWMFPKTDNYWTISPYAYSERSYMVWYVNGGKGYISADNFYVSRNVLPVLYLNSNIHLEGEGTSTKPYTIVS